MTYRVPLEGIWEVLSGRPGANYLWFASAGKRMAARRVAVWSAGDGAAVPAAFPDFASGAGGGSVDGNRVAAAA